MPDPQTARPVFLDHHSTTPVAPRVLEAMADAYRDAIENRRPQLQKILGNCFAGERLDAILFPTTILPATPIGEDDLVDLGGREAPLFPSFVHNTDPGSTAGIPGITLPAGLSESGLPIGLQLMGPPFGEERVLSVGHQYQRLTDHHTKRPPPLSENRGAP